MLPRVHAKQKYDTWKAGRAGGVAIPLHFVLQFAHQDETIESQVALPRT